MPPRKVANIPDRSNPAQPMFVTWHDENSKRIALTTAAQASEHYGVIANAERSVGTNIFGNVSPNISVRDGMSRNDWSYFRPEESTPRGVRNIIYACMQVYKRVGIIRNIVDVMGEFTCQGLRLVHPNPRIQDIYQEWARRINLYERAERFCNYLYRTANVVVQRETAKLSQAKLDEFRQGLAAEDIEPVDPPPPVRKGEIPWNYTYLNLLQLELLGGEDLAQFTGIPMYGLPIPEKVYNKIRTPKTPEEKYLIQQLPEYIIKAARGGVKVVPLDPAKVQTFYFKKDDWQLWAEPMTYGIIDDLILYNKLKLADLAALDGAISHIRLWKLGDLENRIFPTPAAMARLADILVNNTAVGAVDLIWGPELTLEETSTEVHRFLGSEKYEACLNAIYDGMGVPSSLRSGSISGKGGMTSYLSLKVMIERLKYGRKILNSFLETEVRMFQRAMGLRFPAEIMYDYMTLTDEAAFLKLLIDLADRDLLSIETLQETFGNIPEIETLRIKREHQQRESGKRRPKAGPYHAPQVEDDLLKIFAQTGIITPGEAGIELGEKEPGQKNVMDYKLQQIKSAPKPTAPGGIGGNPKGNPNQQKKVAKPNGRPAGKKDSGPRKPKALKPAKAAEFFTTRAWAREIQSVIADIVNPVFLEECGKKNVRSLTDKEVKDLEDFKFALLCNLEPHTPFTIDTLAEMVQNPLPIPLLIQELLSTTLSKFTEKFNRAPTIDEIRLFQAEVYSLHSEADMEDDE
jgi:hypothetical protein